MALPASGVMGGDTVTQGVFKTEIEKFRDHTAILFGSLTEEALTISGGSVTPTAATVSIDTESALETDDLTNISAVNFEDDKFLVVRAFHTDRTVVLKHQATGAGELFLSGGVDAPLDDDFKVIIFRYDTSNTQWVEMFRNWLPTPILDKLDATVAPTATDDSVAGYSVGSQWIDVTGNQEYVCVDSTAAAAVWIKTTFTSGDVFPSGTKMLFQQTTAPTGWTKDTTHNNKAFRVVSGSVVNGGTHSFTTVFGTGKVTGSRVLTVANLPAHSHIMFVRTDGSAALTSSTQVVADRVATGTFGGSNYEMFNAGGTPNGGKTGNTGSGTGHTHTIGNFDLQFVDIIIAIKD